MPALDAIMERASQSLAAMDYLTTETLCLEAVAQARRQCDWADYSRILLPLQEARRQRRIIASEEGVVRLGISGLDATPAILLARMNKGCIVLTRPASAADAKALQGAARQQRQHVEVLYADSVVSDDRWTLRSFAGPDLSCPVKVPPADWRDRWLEEPIARSAIQPADWFIDATEALGDAAIAWVDEQAGPLDASPRDAGQALRRLELLEACLDVVVDHEKLHQRLGDAARALRVMSP